MVTNFFNLFILANRDKAVQILLPMLLFCLTANLYATTTISDYDYPRKDDTYTAVATATIGDYVWNDLNRNGKQDNYERGIKDIIVGLYEKGADGVFSTEDDVLVDYITTNDDGEYVFQGVAAGEYVVKLLDFSFPTDFIVCPKNAGNDINKDSDFNQETATSDPFEVTPQMNFRSLDAGLFNQCAGFIPNMTIGHGQVLAAGSVPETLTILHPNIANPSDYEFQWMKKTAYTDWMPIPGANEMSYTPSAVFTDTYYVLCYRLAGCTESDYKESNVLVIEIGHCTASILTDNTEFCVDEQATFTSGNSSVNLSYTWSVEGGVVSSSTGNSTNITWFEPGQYYIELTATSPNGCESTTRKLVHVFECNDFACCANGQVLASLCYSFVPQTGSGAVLCSISVPCNLTDDYILTGSYFCGPCASDPACFNSPLQADGFNEVEANTERSTKESIVNTNVFPNPASGQVTLSLDMVYSDTPSTVTIQLLDMQSKIQQQMVVPSTATDYLVFNLSVLPDGLYLFKIVNGNEAPTFKKFVKIQE